MRVYAVTEFSCSRNAAHVPRTRVFADKKEAYAFYESIQLFGHVRAEGKLELSGEESAVERDTHVQQPRGKVIQAYDLP
jgi:hypothetical protein